METRKINGKIFTYITHAETKFKANQIAKQCKEEYGYRYIRIIEDNKFGVFRIYGRKKA